MTLRWGIIGTGLISSWFTGDVKKVSTVTAVGASSVAKAEAFKEKLGLDCFCGSYEEVYARDDVDVVYIGLPHTFHLDAALAAIAQGKHVLVEKPACINAAQFRQMAAAAQERGVFLMEGMWLKFRPIVEALQRVDVGKVHRVFVDFSLDLGVDALPADSRLKSNELGAGCLLDVGIYGLTYAQLLLEGEPKVHAVQEVKNGMDYMTSCLLDYGDAHAIVTSSVYSRTDEAFARVEGDKGTLVIKGVAPSVPSSYVFNGEEVSFEVDGFGFQFESAAVEEAIAAGKLEHPLHTWKDTLYILETMDAIRRDNGLVYPADLTAAN